jgi:hypothetical protein
MASEILIISLGFEDTITIYFSRIIDYRSTNIFLIEIFSKKFLKEKLFN